ncbi:MAG: 50S ribosomal protein L11 methyltransferase [Bacteroidales bacterium]|jgi:ribosomal protein L11 methyltransferase
MDYIEFNFTITPKESGNEILTATLADIGFESFVETETGLLAYVPDTKFSVNEVEKLDILHNKEFNVMFDFKTIPAKNWNEEWESSYNPVTISDKCNVRAPFHPQNDKCKYDIIIEPKMSFGTAHHETTALMLEQILKLDLNHKTVLDMGCGTAVLSILAAKMGASIVTAIDIDEWAFNNSVENVEKNKADKVKVLFGDVSIVKDSYDVVFANINRNILIKDIPEYTNHLNKSGLLLLSGFYEADVPIIADKAESNGMKSTGSFIKNNWVVLTFKKK